MDEIEQEYIYAIRRAADTDAAFELMIGLQQYRELYKS